jgi:hypothetical protein
MPETSSYRVPLTWFQRQASRLWYLWMKTLLPEGRYEITVEKQRILIRPLKEDEDP